MSQSGQVNTGGGPTGEVVSLTGNSGGTVYSDALGNINVVGTGVISVTDNPGTHTLTISSSGGGSGITTIDGDTGSITGATVTFDAATQAGSSISFSGSGDCFYLCAGKFICWRWSWRLR